MTQTSKRWRSRTLPALLREQEKWARTQPEREFAPPARQPVGWIVECGAADVLAPFARLPEYASEYIEIWRLDAPAAATLLDLLPESELAYREGDPRPGVGDALQCVAENPGVVSAFGYLHGPDRGLECLTIRGVTIDDPDLLSFRPDMAFGTTPSFTDLGECDLVKYEIHREECLTSSVCRQQITAVRHRYGLRSTEHWPREFETCVNPATGRRELLLRWK